MLRKTSQFISSVIGSVKPPPFRRVIPNSKIRPFSVVPFKMTQFRLSGVDKSELKPGFMKEVTVEGIEAAKLLLVQVGNSVNAISPRCTYVHAVMLNQYLNPLLCVRLT